MTSTSGQGEDGASSARSGTRAQTLERALDVLQVLADGRPRSSQELATVIGLHRSVVYRIVRTLEDRALVRRASDGRYALGLGLLVLARTVLGETQSQLQDVLRALANEVSATAYLAVPHGQEVVALVSAQPSQAATAIAYQPGARSPLNRGACGLAILSAEAPRSGERAEVGWARQTGYVHTVGEVHAGLSELAAPVRLGPGAVGAVAVIFVAGDVDERHASDAVRRTAAQLSVSPDVWEL